MINLTLYKKELKSSWKLLVIIAGVLTLYITMIIGMFDPEMADALKQFEELMPEVMAAVGMTGTGDTLAGFMISYLYGMLMLVFPMVYTIIRSNGLVAKYVDRGSMASLLAAPVHRTTVALTQLAVLFTGIFLLLGYCTALELATAQGPVPGRAGGGGAAAAQCGIAVPPAVHRRLLLPVLLCLPGHQIQPGLWGGCAGAHVCGADAGQHGRQAGEHEVRHHLLPLSGRGPGERRERSMAVRGHSAGGRCPLVGAGHYGIPAQRPAPVRKRPVCQFGRQAVFYAFSGN